MSFFIISLIHEYPTICFNTADGTIASLGHAGGHVWSLHLMQSLIGRSLLELGLLCVAKISRLSLKH